MWRPLDAVSLPKADRPPLPMRLLVALSTSPAAARLTTSSPLNRHLRKLMTAGWMVRQAYYRNWMIWRSVDAPVRGVLVLPMERVGDEDGFALFVAAEVLRATRGLRTLDAALAKRLVPALAGLDGAALRARCLTVERALTTWRWWR